jgi:hypothetical protein
VAAGTVFARQDGSHSITSAFQSISTTAYSRALRLLKLPAHGFLSTAGMPVFLVLTALYLCIGILPVSALEPAVAYENETFEGPFYLANTSYSSITLKNCVFNGDFIIGQNDAINSIVLDSCVTNGNVLIFNNNKIDTLRMNNCAFNGSMNIFNNSNIARDVEIQYCTMDYAKNIIGNNHIYGNFRFTGNTVNSDITIQLNVIEQYSSIKDNHFDKLRFDLNTLNSITVFTGNTYTTDAVFNSPFFNGLVIFDNETINNKMGFIEGHFKSKFRITNMKKETVENPSTVNFERNYFMDEIRIDNISGGIELFNLYSNDFNVFNIDINLLMRNKDNISATTLEGSEVKDVRIIKNVKKELDVEERRKYDNFLVRMIDNYKRLNLRDAVIIMERTSAFNQFDAKSAVSKYWHLALYFVSFEQFSNYFMALLYGFITIVVFALFYLSDKNLPHIKKQGLSIFKIKKALITSIKVFFNVQFGKSEPRKGWLLYVEAILGIYFILSVPLIIGRLLKF